MNKIALAPTSLPDTGPLEYVKACAEAGYEAIGLRVYRSPGVNYPFYPVVDDPQVASEVKKAITDSNLEVVDVLSFYILPDIDFEPMKKPLAFAQELNATYALVIGDDDNWDRQVENYTKFCELAASFGLITAIEAPVVSRKVNRLEKAVNLCKATGRSDAVVCLDPMQFFRVGDTADMIKSYDPALFPYTQITDGPQTGERCALGAGGADNYGILDNLAPNVPISLEWPAPSGSNYTPVEWAKYALDGCNAYLDAYYAAKK